MSYFIDGVTLLKRCDNFERGLTIRVYRDLDEYIKSGFCDCTICLEQFIDYFCTDEIEYFRFLDFKTVEILIL